MSRVIKTICDRCGEEIVYRGWTSKLRFAKNEQLQAENEALKERIDTLLHPNF